MNGNDLIQKQLALAKLGLMKKPFTLFALSIFCSFAAIGQTQLLSGMGNYLNPGYHPQGAENSFSFGTGLLQGTNLPATTMGAAFASTLGSYKVGINIWNQNFFSNNSEYNLSISRKFEIGNSWLSLGGAGSYIKRSYDVYRLPFRSYTLSGGLVYGHGHHRVGFSLNNFAGSSITIGLKDEPMYASFFYLGTFELGAFEVQPFATLRTDIRNYEGHNPGIIGYRDYNLVNAAGVSTKFKNVKAGLILNEFSVPGFNLGYDFSTFSVNYGYQTAQNSRSYESSAHFISIRFSPNGATTGMQMF